MKVTVKPFAPIEDMWVKVLNSARATVGKEETVLNPSDEFKRSILRSKHSPIRKLKFEVTMQDVPAYVTQQFSRHHICIESDPGYMFSENIVPTDIEHYVQTSREDRTSIPRGERKQTDLVDYSFDINAAGLFAASEKRLCGAADRLAIRTWSGVVESVKKIDPIIASCCQPQCVVYGFCPENKALVKCNFDKTPLFIALRKGYVNE
jgi:hypothetical protein